MSKRLHTPFKKNKNSFTSKIVNNEEVTPITKKTKKTPIIKMEVDEVNDSL